MQTVTLGKKTSFLSLSPPTFAVVTPRTIGSMNTRIEASWIFVEGFKESGHIQVLQGIPASFDPIRIARNDRFISFAVPGISHNPLFNLEADDVLGNKSLAAEKCFSLGIHHYHYRHPFSPVYASYSQSELARATFDVEDK